MITILKKRRSQKNEVETVALLQDLIQQIDDPTLRDRILQETDKLIKQKKFGLVFEEHLPECTPLYDVPIRVGSKVALKTGYVSDIYTVVKIDSDKVLCDRRETHEQKIFKLDEIVVVAEFGEPIYPTLKLIDTVENAPDSDLWHTLIEADNYHALQLLEYLYAEKVDCIYIDPPYNTGAKDWKYNNDYVDSSDAYRHSKWLSMMEKRLKLAKKLLNPEDSVLIVTIDEKEYLHLGCLLEEIFSGETMQMVSITINPSGAKRDNLFSRSDEYAYIILFGNAQVVHPKGNGDEREVRWWYLRRTDYASRRGTVKGGVAQFYPIYVDDKTMKIVAIGEALKPEQSRFDVPAIEGATPVFPVRDDGVEMNWGITGDSLQQLCKEGVVRVSPGSKNQPYVFRYLSANYVDKIKSGRWAVRGLREDGTKIVVETEGNAVFFKLSFLDKTSVALGRQFKELLPVLWMKGGAIGKCPALESDELPEMLILPQNKMAVLINEIYYSEFDAELSQHPEIQTVFIVTDSEIAYRSMIRAYDGKTCYQLYRDYLDNFRINTGR